MARRRREFSVFNLSFLDVISCGLGAVILFFVITNTQVKGRVQEALEDLYNETELIKEEIFDEQVRKARINNTRERTEQKDQIIKGSIRILRESIEKLTKELAQYNNQTLAATISNEQLRLDVKQVEEANKRMTAESLRKKDPGESFTPFDGDGDRLIAVDERGKQIDGDKIIALFAKYYLKTKQLNKKTIVTTVMSNLGLENYLKKLGIKLVRTNVGDCNVIAEMKKNSYVLGGEQSGHIILGNYLNTGDGILAAVKIIEIISSEKTKASKIFSLYDQYPQIKTNLLIKKKPNGFFDKTLNNIVKENKANNPKIRYLVRKSGTEPLVRILVEGQDSDKVIRASKIINNQINKVLNAR